MTTGSLTLSQYPAEMVRLACDRCPRRGQLSRARLIEQYGGDILLPDLRLRIAACTRPSGSLDPCGVYFPDLRPLNTKEP